MVPYYYKFKLLIGLGVRSTEVGPGCAQLLKAETVRKALSKDEAVQETVQGVGFRGIGFQLKGFRV